jgi:hypothetical protein
MPARDEQVGGEHYRKRKHQPWDVMEDWLTPEQFTGYLRGTIVKYISRYRDKGGVEDLKKTKHVLEKLIELETVKETK